MKVFMIYDLFVYFEHEMILKISLVHSVNHNLRIVQDFWGVFLPTFSLYEDDGNLFRMLLIFYEYQSLGDINNASFKFSLQFYSNTKIYLK